MTPCYYCELSRDEACKVCIHGEADAGELQANAQDAARYRWLTQESREYIHTDCFKFMAYRSGPEIADAIDTEMTKCAAAPSTAQKDGGME